MKSRSRLTLKDEDTKFGTELDGMKMERGENRLLENNEHTFRLGKTEHIFRFVLFNIVSSEADGKTKREMATSGLDILLQL